MKQVSKKSLIWVLAFLISSLGMMKAAHAGEFDQLVSGLDNIVSTFGRTIFIEDYALHLYPDSDDLEDNDISVSIDERMTPDSCFGPFSESYFTIDHRGSCADITFHYDTDMGPATEKTRYCSGKVYRTPEHTYRVKQVLDRCERFNHLVIDGGGVKHEDLFRYPLIRLSDENGKVWVTDFAKFRHFAKADRNSTITETDNNDCDPEENPDGCEF
jgi:hypothetical protein